MFAREYAIVEAMRAAWTGDIQRFFEKLHSAVEQRLREKHPEARLLTKRTQGYLYWWIPSGEPKIGSAAFWYNSEYPELIRDKQVHWSAYLDIDGRKAQEEIQDSWVRLATPELRKLPPEFSFAPGASGTFKPLRLVVHWKEDPIAESAGLLADSLEILHRAVSQVKESL